MKEGTGVSLQNYRNEMESTEVRIDFEEKKSSERRDSLNITETVVGAGVEYMVEETAGRNATEKRRNSLNIPEKDLCKICMGAIKTHVLIPCGHTICGKCGEGLKQCVPSTCRQSYQNISNLKVYIIRYYHK